MPTGEDLPKTGEMGQNTPGDLVIIGGAEDKLNRRTVLKEFIARSGGDSARIVVIPTASSLGPEIVDVYDAAFRKLGAASILGVRPEDREQANHPSFVDQLLGATGIFMTGGNQLKLSSVLAGTAFGDAILDAHERGVTIGGTSAGASIQSSHMVAFGPGGATPKQRMTQVAAGLGLLEDCVIDQHFDQRNRYGRLLMIVSQSPQLLGIGVDEDTAAIVSPTPDGYVLSVVGRGSVTILDPANMVTNAHEAARSQPILASGVLLHVLPAGSSYNLNQRTLVRAVPAANPTEIAELAVANRDLRKLARDIAAGDVSPAQLRRRVARRSKGVHK
ncbi:MAG: cyanophycinase [Marmoricola sp.]|nr:cyanophycinase [Marmoricola sp.]